MSFAGKHVTKDPVILQPQIFVLKLFNIFYILYLFLESSNVKLSPTNILTHIYETGNLCLT